MRAVIKIKTTDNKLNQLTLEGFLQSEGYNVVDFARDKTWLELPDQKPLSDKIEIFKNSIFTLDRRDINPIAYIYNNMTEGLISFNSNTAQYGIRIFKHNKRELLLNCEQLVESLLTHFERNSSKLEISPIGIKEKEQPEDTITGEVLKDKKSKIEKAIQDKKIEYKAGKLLLILASILIVFSFCANIFFNSEVNQNNLIKWFVQFFERITGPLLITGSVSLYNYWTVRQKYISNKSTIIWK